MTANRHETFASIFRTQRWGATETVSGPGSTLRATEYVRSILPKLFAWLEVEVLLDIPCGDFHWMRHVALPPVYIGGDIVPELVDTNQQEFGNAEGSGVFFRSAAGNISNVTQTLANRKKTPDALTRRTRCFVNLDLVQSALPEADLVLCRDCLVHLCFADVFAALRNMKRSGSAYLLTTTFPQKAQNKDIPDGRWRPLNLEKPPFNLSPPLILFNERNYLGTRYYDKSLGLWRIADLEI
jgi:hypothetical protein